MQMTYRRWIIIAIFLFGAGVVLGLTATGTDSLLSEELETIEELSSILSPFNIFTFIFIFIKNVSTLLLSFVLSPILCLTPILALTLNGWLLAFVSVAVTQEKSLSFVVAGLLPHGIFELPALILGEAAALSFGTMVLLALFKRERRVLLLPGLRQNLKYLMVACALLLPAAIIETFITPILLK